MDIDENNKREQKIINTEKEKCGGNIKNEGVPNTHENTATGRAASSKGHLNAARIVTLPGGGGRRGERGIR
jgi:hypothetical protein